MSLSDAERAALVARQQGLSHELSSRTAAASAAQLEASQTRKDAKLIAEIDRLQRARDEVVAKQDAASGSVADAMAAMEAAAAALVPPSAPLPEPAPEVDAEVDNDDDGVKPMEFTEAAEDSASPAFTASGLFVNSTDEGGAE